MFLPPEWPGIMTWHYFSALYQKACPSPNFLLPSVWSDWVYPLSPTHRGVLIILSNQNYTSNSNYWLSWFWFCRVLFLPQVWPNPTLATHPFSKHDPSRQSFSLVSSGSRDKRQMPPCGAGLQAISETLMFHLLRCVSQGKEVKQQPGMIPGLGVRRSGIRF